MNLSNYVYRVGCLLNFACFESNYRLTTADLSKQKALDADSREIQQIIFTGKIKSTVAKRSNNLQHSQIDN